MSVKSLIPSGLLHATVVADDSKNINQTILQDSD